MDTEGIDAMIVMHWLKAYLGHLVFAALYLGTCGLAIWAAQP